MALTAGLWYPLTTVMHSQVPLADAGTTALSLLATYGQCRKLVEKVRAAARTCTC